MIIHFLVSVESSHPSLFSLKIVERSRPKLCVCGVFKPSIPGYERAGARRREKNDLTHKIAFLIGIASEDSALIRNVCDHASITDSNTKEAVRALRRELKYGEPAEQLAATRARLLLGDEIADEQLLDTLEVLLASSRTPHIVRVRVLDVIAAAAYTSGSEHPGIGFRELWLRVKPVDKPEEGIPFDTEDPMFSLPLMVSLRED
ncbi:hypothetical protein B0H13DRAFT_2301864 [Mycena leptocephala]|nr:hypothetical protein B0H13DRAFT_2301864 [Mycena leptocephala]